MGGSRDDLLDLLSHSRRRDVLRLVTDHGPLALADIAEEVVVGETGCPITELSAEEIREVYLSLYHVHVPKLERAGLVDHDDDADVVCLTDVGRSLRPGMEDVASRLGESAEEPSVPPDVVRSEVDAANEADTEDDDGDGRGSEPTISVSLTKGTIEALHHLIENDERIDPTMSYDAVIRMVLGWTLSDGESADD